MTVPTSIPETSMAHPEYESLQESKTPTVPDQQKVLDIKDEEENQSFSKWMKHRGMTTLLTSVLISVTFWTESMTTVSSEQMA